MPWKLDRRAQVLALGAILLLALVLRSWGLTWGLHDANVSARAQPDEWVLYWLFQWFGGSHSLNPCPDSVHRCFFDWGSVYPYLAYGMHFILSPFIGHMPPHAFGPQSQSNYIY